MGRPSFRRVVLRDHGTERRKRLPTMGTAPKTQEQTLRKNKIAWTPKGCVPTLRPPSWQKQSGTARQTGQILHHTIQYRKQGAQHRRHPPNTETRQGWFPGPRRGRGRTPAPSTLGTDIQFLDTQTANRNHSNCESRKFAIWILESQNATKDTTKMSVNQIATKIPMTRTAMSWNRVGLASKSLAIWTPKIQLALMESPWAHGAPSLSLSLSLLQLLFATTDLHSFRRCPVDILPFMICPSLLRLRPDKAFVQILNGINPCLCELKARTYLRILGRSSDEPVP